MSPAAHPSENPVDPYLQGLYAPTAAELSAEALAVHGEIPPDLSGVYVRNGPNPKRAAPGRHHWFDGDGMLHAIALANGRAHYRNRYIRTAHLAEEDAAGRALWRGLMEPTVENPGHAPYKDTANTDVLLHAGSLLTLWYISGEPYRVDAHSLETLGVDRFDGGSTAAGDAPRRISAHAKVDERSGELMWFDYGPRPPFMRYGVVGRDRRLVHATAVELPGPRLPHDMAITDSHSVLMDLPVFFNEAAMKRRQWIVDFHRDTPSRFGVLPRHGNGGDIRWFEAEPCYVYHVVNAWHEGDELVMVGCRCDEPTPEPDPNDGAMAQAFANLRLRAQLHRWRFNLADGTTREERLDDRNVEFPTIAMASQGRHNRWGYAMTIPHSHTLLFDGVAKYALDDGSGETLSFGEGRYGSEVAFAPRDGACDEDDGYLLSIVQRDADEPAELWIIRAQALNDGPVARVVLPQRVPLGFHACWAPAGAIDRRPDEARSSV
jgi:carotenoid cleavage dioxygenase